MPDRSQYLAYNPIYREVYVSIPNLDKVVVLEIANWQIVADIPIVQNNAQKIIFNPYDNKMYLIHGNLLNPATVSIIDPPTKLVKTIDTKYRPADIAVNPVNRHIYVLSDGGGIVSIIDTDKRKVIGNVIFGNRGDNFLTFNPVDDNMYLFGTYFITVIDSTTNTVSNIIPESYAPESNPIINPINNKMYMASTLDDVKQIISKQFNTNIVP